MNLFFHKSLEFWIINYSLSGPAYRCVKWHKHLLLHSHLLSRNMTMLSHMVQIKFVYLVLNYRLMKSTVVPNSTSERLSFLSDGLQVAFSSILLLVIDSAEGK